MKWYGMSDDEIQEFRRFGKHVPNCNGLHDTYGMCLEDKEIEWINVKPKQNERPSLQEIVSQAKERLGKPVGWRWYVEEYLPAHNSGDYDDIDYPDQTISRSDYFYSSDEAVEYMESLQTERPEYRLRVRAQTCYERLERYWM